MTATATVPKKANAKRQRLRLIRRRDRVRKGLPLRSDAGSPRARRTEDGEDRDLDTPDPELIGVTDFADELAR